MADLTPAEPGNIEPISSFSGVKFATDVTSSFKVSELNLSIETQPLCGTFSILKKQTLIEAGFVKYTCPFGVLIVAEKDYPDEYMLYGANIVAELLDKNLDGAVDVPSIRSLINQESGLLFAGIISNEMFIKCQNLYVNGASSYSKVTDCQAFYTEIMKDEAAIKANIYSTVFNKALMNGWSKVFPEELGNINYLTSILGQEVALLQCVSPGWKNPFNTGCPAVGLEAGMAVESPLKDGICITPECDITNFMSFTYGFFKGWLSYEDAKKYLPWYPTTAD